MLASRSIKEVTLNSAELKIKKCYLIKNGKTIHTKFSLNEKKEIIETIKGDDFIENALYIRTIHFLNITLLVKIVKIIK